MPEHYDSQAGAYVNVDEQGVVRGLVQEEPAPTEAASAREAADQYLRDHSELLGVAPAELENLAATREVAPVAAGSQFRLRSENTQFDTTTVTYEQTMYGLPVWEAGVSVHVKEGPFRVVGADTTRTPTSPRRGTCPTSRTSSRTSSGSTSGSTTSGWPRSSV
jgi:zinc metalloprotease ZmpB